MKKSIIILYDLDAEKERQAYETSIIRVIMEVMMSQRLRG